MIPEKKKMLIIGLIALVALIVIIIAIYFLTEAIKRNNESILISNNFSNEIAEYLKQNNFEEEKGVVALEHPYTKIDKASV